MGEPHYVARVRAKAFRSIDGWTEARFEPGLNAVVGPNGAGKSTLLDAIAFAAGAPASFFGARGLLELKNDGSAETCEVELTLAPVARPAAPGVVVRAELKANGTRALRLGGKLAPAKVVRRELRRVGLALHAGRVLR